MSLIIGTTSIGIKAGRRGLLFRWNLKGMGFKKRCFGCHGFCECGPFMWEW